MNRIHLLIVFSLLAFVACESFPRKDPELIGQPVATEPTALGCSGPEYDDLQMWAHCVRGTLLYLQKITNAIPVVLITAEDRIDDTSVKQSIKVCRDTFCSEFQRTRYSPTFYRRVMDNLEVAATGAGAVLLLIGGYAIKAKAIALVFFL